MIYSKIFKFAFACISFAVLTACNSKNEEAKKLGFSSATEMDEIHAKGWHTKERYEEDIAISLGYKSASAQKSEELKIKKQKEFEEIWKNNGTHYTAIACISPGYTLAENAMLMLMNFGPENFFRTANNFSEFCNASDLSKSDKTWDKHLTSVRILGRKNNVIYWYALIKNEITPNYPTGIGGFTKYDK